MATVARAFQWHGAPSASEPVRIVHGGRPWDEVALEALTGALDGLEERFGRSPERWRWGHREQRLPPSLVP